jgi:hypothetical protein
MALLINRSRPNKTAKNGNTGLNFVNDGVLTHYTTHIKYFNG